MYFWKFSLHFKTAVIPGFEISAPGDVILDTAMTPVADTFTTVIVHRV